MLSTHLVSSLLLLSMTLLPPPGADTSAVEAVTPTAQRLIAAVPPGAVAVGYCESLPRLRERARENVWYQIMGRDAGDAWRGAAEGPGLSALRDGLHGREPGDELVRELWDQLPGGLVVSARSGGGGLVLETTGIEDRIDAALDHLLRGPRSEWRATALEHRELFLEGLAPAGASWEQAAAPPADSEAGRVALAPSPAALDPGALVIARGEGHLFLLAGSDPVDVLATARASIDGWRSGTSPSGDLFRRARASVGAAGLEVFVDLSVLIDEARDEFARADSQLDVDPITLLGLDGEAWVYATLDLFASDRVDARGRLAIPRGGVAARALATLQSLPADLLARVPKDATGISALNWNVSAFFDLVAEVARELSPEGEGLSMEGLLESGKGLTGVDFEEDVIRQLSGLFVSYMLSSSEETRAHATEHLTDTVWYLGLRDASRFQAAVEQLLGLVPGALSSDIVMTDVAGADVYHYAGAWDAGLAPGIAFAPSALLFTLRHTLLERALTTLARADESPSMLDAQRFTAAFDESRGAVAFVAMELRLLEHHLMPDGPAPSQNGAEGEVKEIPDPFRRLLVYTVRPSAAGLDFRLLTR